MAHVKRVRISNPTKRKKRRKPKGETTMAKRRKRRARKAKTNPKRRAHRAKRRARRSNPKRRSTKRRRARRANPVRRHRRRAKRRTSHARVRRHNPRRRHKHRRRSRRNPSIPIWAQAAVAAALATLGFAVSSAGALALTQALDPGLESLPRNRYIVGGLLTIGGLALATKAPVYGAGLAAGALIGTGLGSKLAMALQALVIKRPTAPTVQAVYGQNMAGYQSMQGYERMAGYLPMQAVYGQNMQAVYGQDMAGIGDFIPNAPWTSQNPF